MGGLLSDVLIYSHKFAEIKLLRVLHDQAFVFVLLNSLGHIVCMFVQQKTQ